MKTIKESVVHYHYIAKDGKSFTNKNECINYEKSSAKELEQRKAFKEDIIDDMRIVKSEIENYKKKYNCLVTVDENLNIFFPEEENVNDKSAEYMIKFINSLFY